MKYIEKLKRSLFEDGHSDLDLRVQLFGHIYSDLSLSSELDTKDKNLDSYIKKLTLNAHEISDNDIDLLKEDYSEDEIFELTVTGSVAAGLGRVNKAMALLNYFRS